MRTTWVARELISPTPMTTTPATQPAQFATGWFKVQRMIATYQMTSQNRFVQTLVFVSPPFVYRSTCVLTSATGLDGDERAGNRGQFRLVPRIKRRLYEPDSFRLYRVRSAG